MLFRSLVVLFVLVARAQDWPMYLRDPTHSSYNPFESLLNSSTATQLGLQWSINVGAAVSTGVTVSNGVLFFGAWDGVLYAVDAATGITLWQQFLGKAPDPADPSCGAGIGIAAQPTVSGDIVYAAGGDSAVYALDRYTGAILWRVLLADPASGSFIWSSLVASGNALYVGMASLADCPLVRGAIARIPLDNPSQPLIRFLVPDGSIGAGIWSTPAVDEQANLLYVTTGNADVQDAQQGIWGSALLALDATTLAIQAYFFLPLQPGDVDADWGSSPLLFQAPDGSQFVAASGKNGVMYVLRRPELALQWAASIAVGCISPEDGCGSLSTPAFDGLTLFTGAGVSPEYSGLGYNGSVYAFDPAGPTLLWSYPAEGVVIAPVTVTPGVVYVPTTQGMVILDAATGTELWRDDGAAGLYGQAVVVNGMLYCTYVSGDVTAWSVAGGGYIMARQGQAHVPAAAPADRRRMAPPQSRRRKSRP